ncbi:hypothetical protein [Curtobacterium oceanosedimentum]|uniref:hypothetical protein n=1 Tax=Curtobacterium oceanosedimentum TaxID=465820 RepID=UPI001CE02C56|nr:hypothetical protein [Curtobacterium oceanosedimentum]
MLRPLDLEAHRLDPSSAPTIIRRLNETDAAAAWMVHEASREVGWVAVRTAPLAGRSAGVVRAGLRAPDPIGPIEESMLATSSGDALRLVQRLALERPGGARFVVVQASWSWVVGDELVVLSSSSAEPALAELLITRIDALAAKIVIDA